MKSDTHALADAERSFAGMALEKGTQAAFVANMAGDSVLLRPGPVNGQKWIAEHPFGPGQLKWHPIVAQVSAAGDLGWTTGPWEFRKDPADAKPLGQGYFFSVWRKQADGTWKVELDHGVSTPAFESGMPQWQEPPARAAAKAAKDDPAKAQKKLELANVFTSYEAVLAEDARVYREDHFPAVGRAASLALVKAENTSWEWEKVNGVGVSRSGDLGYVYGSGRSGDGKTEANYVRVWRLEPDGAWKLAVEVVTLIPKRP